MALSLPKEAFVALATIGWVDDRLTAIEREGLLRAARACGVDGEDLDAVEAALAERGSLEDFVPGEMSPFQCALTYALACWFARLDGVVSTEEHESLSTLARRLDLDEATTKRASVAAFEVSVLPEGGRPDKFDFEKLAEKLVERLPRLSSI